MPITLLIHGPISDYSRLVLADGRKAVENGLVDDCVIVTYKKEEAKLRTTARDALEWARVALVDDVRNPGFANINRQINMVRSGMQSVDANDRIIVKLRSDQRVSLAKVRNIIAMHQHALQAGALLTTNCYTRKDRLYHPSDMFLIALKATLLDYYPAQFFAQTELDDHMAIRETSRASKSLLTIEQWPESRLYRHLLASRAWVFRNTIEDSVAALRAHCVMLDSRSIRLKWEKFYGGHVTLVPYDFQMAPFEGVVKEQAQCFTVEELHGRDAGQSRVTRLMTRLLWNDFYLAGRHYGSYWKGFRKVVKGQYTAR
jgi:hypothetical protein